MKNKRKKAMTILLWLYIAHNLLITAPMGAIGCTLGATNGEWKTPFILDKEIYQKHTVKAVGYTLGYPGAVFGCWLSDPHNPFRSEKSLTDSEPNDIVD